VYNFKTKTNGNTYRNRKGLGYYDGSSLRNERANCTILYSKLMRTQLDDLNKELRDINKTLKTEMPYEFRARLLKRKEHVRSIIYNIQ
jgi:hypothetical protein